MNYIKKCKQMSFPFLKRETFFGGRIPIQIKLEFPYSPKELNGITEQIVLFSEEGDAGEDSLRQCWSASEIRQR